MNNIFFLIISGIITSNVVSSAFVGSDTLVLSKATIKDVAVSGLSVTAASVAACAFCRAVLLILPGSLQIYFMTPIYIFAGFGFLYGTVLLSRLVFRRNLFEGYALTMFAALGGTVAFVADKSACESSFLGALIFAAAMGLGFTLFLLLFRITKLKCVSSKAPACLRSYACDLIIAAVIALVFSGFNEII